MGTTSVDISELLSRTLNMRGIKHNVLNAKQHQREAEIVSEAGKSGAVTIATNMAGRGTDIKIGEDVKQLLPPKDTTLDVWTDSSEVEREDKEIQVHHSFMCHWKIIS